MDNTQLYIHHHLGLGDHIVCNAIVRNLRKKIPNEIILAVKRINFSSVVQLYKDLDISFDLVNDDSDCIKNYKNKNVLRIGFENCRSDWERSFYDQVKLPYSRRFSDFYIQRNLEREKTLEAKLNLPKNFSLSMISSSSGKYNIDVVTKLPIIEVTPVTDSIFDWIGVIEKADELHVVDTSIFQLIKQLNIKKKKVFYDTRGIDSTRTTPTFEDNLWEIKKV